MNTFKIYSRQSFLASLFLSLGLSLLSPLSAQSPVFYGMTQNGGSNSDGAIFTLDPSTNNENVVWNFGSGSDGINPYGNLTYDASRKLFYGMTFAGGSNSGGSIFSLDPITNSENVVWSFGSGGSDGVNPSGNLLYDAGNGLFYGMTQSGGTNNNGTIFSFNPGTNSESVVWNFGSSSDGQSPYGSLVYYAGNGLFYGMTQLGGNNGLGSIFAFNPVTNSESVVWSFNLNGTDGAIPYGNLLYYAGNGLFYGMTSTGGSNFAGSIFTFNPGTNGETVVWSFGSGSDGSSPYGDLVYNAGKGLFYGMTFVGGSNSGGTIFTLDPGTNSESVVWNFGSGSDGSSPDGKLVYDAGNDLFYGMTSAGGSNSSGTIFTLDPGTNNENVVWNFGSGTDGAGPHGSLVLYSPCSLSASASVVQNVLCNGGNTGSARVTAGSGTSPYTYSWSDANSQSTDSATGLSAGSYTVTVTDSGSCIVTSSVIISQPAVLSAGITLNNNASACANSGSVTANPSGGISPYTYSWNDPSSQSTPTASGLSAGSYMVIINDSNGCSATATISITAPGVLSPGITINSNASACANTGNATATSSGGTTPYTYSWNDLSSQSTPTASGLSAGSYTVTVKDNNGCSATSSITITAPAPVSAVASVNNNASACSNSGSASVTPGGGKTPYNYIWNDASSQSSATASGLSAGSYTVTVSDNKGCSATASVGITAPTALTASASVNNDASTCSNNGSATVAPGGGSSPYNYSWSDQYSQSSPTATALSGGSYTVVVTDNTGCTATASVIITQSPSTLSVSAITNTNVICNKGADGSATATPSGGATPYTYFWSGGGVNSTKSFMTAGTYTVTVYDNNECSVTASVVITQPPAILINITINSNVSCNGTNTGSATASVSGGTSPYTYSWTGDKTTATASGLYAGNYKLTVTDNTGCTSSVSITITQPTALKTSLNITNVSCNGASNGSVAANPSGGTLPYTYSWTNGNTNNTITGLPPGIYKVTVTDSSGCTASASTIITQPSTLKASPAVTNISCNGANNGIGIAHPSGGTSPYTYSWTNGSVSDTATGMAAGTFTITLMDNNGCTATASITVTQPSALTSIATVNTNVNCNSGSTGSATVSSSGGTSPYTYTWTNGSNSTAATGLSAGGYTATVTDKNGCTVTSSVNITQPLVISPGASVSTNVSCNGGSSGSANASPSGGVSPYTYSWNNGITKSSVTGLSAGTYTVTVKDKNGCSGTASVGITQPSTVTTGISVNANVACHGGSGGSLTANPAGGVSPYTYSWSGGGANASKTGLTAGTYTVKVTDNNGCSQTASAAITQPSALTASTSPANVSCNGGTNGSATANPSGGISPYTYSWTNGSTNVTITGLSIGTYTVTVHDSNGCSATSSAIIGQPSVLSVSTSNVNVSCNGGANGSATANQSGGTSPYSYSWTNGSVNIVATGLSVGTYTVTVTDNHGCTATASAGITQPTALSAGAGASANVSCNGGANGSATANQSGGTSPYTYSWNNGKTTLTASGLSAGTYTVTITDNKGCNATASALITQPSALFAGASTNINVSCNGGTNGSVSANSSGGVSPYTYSWNNGVTNINATGLSAGTYTVTIKDNNGCTATASANISQPFVLSATPTVNTNASCNGVGNGSATANPSGGTSPYTYSWNNGSTANNATGLYAGTYTVTVKDSNGCTATASANITQPSTLSATTTIPGNVSCNGQANGSATANPSGGTSPYTYSWTSGSIMALATGLSAGTYTVTVMDNKGCTATATANITQPSVLSAFATINSNVSCNGQANGSATAGQSGGTSPYTYSWTNGSAAVSSSGLSAGSYTVTVKDMNGCSSTASVLIIQPSTLLTGTVTTNVSCNGGSNGSAKATPSGGTSPYTYSWNNGNTNITATGLSIGTYTVTVKDNKGCSATATAAITQPAALTANTIVNTNVSCNGKTNGSATAIPSGGVSPYTYSWSISGTNAIRTGLGAGSYTVTITDKNGCSATATVNITQPSLLTASTAVTTSISCNGGSNGSATGIPSGGTSPYTYSWSNGNTSVIATGLSATGYNFTVTDSNGCSASIRITMTQPTVVKATITLIANVSCNGGNNGTATANPSGGTSPYFYSWNNGNTNVTAGGLSAGSYTVTVSDANSCSASATVAITQPANALSVAINVTGNVSCNGGSNGKITATPSGGTNPYTYSWSNGSTVYSLSGLSSGSYTITVTDSKGCSATASASITQPFVLKVTTTVTANISCNGSSGGIATANPAGGATPYTYLWSNGEKNAMDTGLHAQSYTITITDNHGCTATATATITQPGAISATTAITGVSCHNGTNGKITAIPAGGTSPYSYSWTSGSTTITATGLSMGTYTVTVTDNNGCSASARGFITQPAAIILTTSVTTNINCYNSSTGIATVAASGGIPPYTYTWQNSQTTATATGLKAGVYTVTARDSNGCTATASASITQNAAIRDSLITGSKVNVTCYGANTGAATIGAIGGTVPYTFSWSNGKTTAAYSSLSAGTYTVTVTDKFGCTGSIVSLTITQPSQLRDSIVTSGTTNIKCRGSATGSAHIGVKGGTAPYTYSWTPGGQTAATASGLSAGTYTVFVMDNNGCSSVGAIAQLTQPSSLVTAIVNTVNLACNGNKNGSATAIPSGGISPYTYSWSGGGANATKTGLAAGSYTLTVRDNNGCSYTQLVTITQPLAVTSSPVVTNVSCNGGSNATANANASGGTSPYSYSWFNGSTNVTVNGLSKGTYTVMVTDVNGCTGSGSATVTQPSVLTATTTATGVTCNGGSNGTATAFPVGGTSPYTYSWTNGNTVPTATALSAGSYTVMVTDSNGCSVTASAGITQPPTLKVSTTVTNVTCNGYANGSATVIPNSGTPPYTYSWTGYGTNATITGLTAGTYPVFVTDSNGCSTVAVATITQPAAVSAVITINANVLCNGGSNGRLTVNASSGVSPYTYSWSNGTTASSNSVLTAGTYSVSVTDAHGCGASASATVTQPTPLTTNLGSVMNISCSGNSTGKATVAAAGGVSPYTYSWNPGGKTTASLTGLSAGNYSVTSKDANGCNSTLLVIITQPSTFVATATVTNITCNGGTNGSATASASGGTPPYTYSWSGFGTNTTITGLSAGTYNVFVTDSNGCSIIWQAKVTQPAVLNTTVTISSPISCNGYANGNITANTSGGTSPYTYSWTSGDITATASGLSIGSYTVVITDNHGCTASSSVTLTQPATLVPSVFVSANVSCNGGANGSLTASASGGVSPYTFSWTNGGTKPIVTGLSAGTYTVTVADKNGCLNFAIAAVTQPAALAPGATVNANVNCNGGANGSAKASCSGGVSPYTYSWSNGNTNITAAGLSAGTYTITLTDNHGCTSTTSTTITQPLALAPGIIDTNAGCNGDSNGIAHAYPSGGVPPYTYSWAAGGGTYAAISGLKIGTYTLTVKDSHGCSASSSTTITQPAVLNASATVNANASCNGGANGSATANVSGGVGPYTYSWTNGNTADTATGLSAGSYTVIVMDSHGCLTVALARITQPAAIIPATTINTNVSCNGGANGSAAASASGGVSPYTYSWNNGITNSAVTGLSAGTYTVTVTDNHGCQITATAKITQPAILTVPLALNAGCNGESNGTVAAHPAGGVNPYTYSWSTGKTTASISGLSGGSYTVTVTDSHGCKATSSVTFTQPVVLTATTTINSNVNCNAGSNGSITANTSGGVTPYTYSWTNGNTTNTATGLSAGNYTVTITDNDGCPITASATITQPVALSGTTSVNANVSCNSGNNGSITAIPSGGTSPYTYSWTNGNTAITASNLTAGNYTVTIMDKNGCQVTASALITQPTALIPATVVNTNVSCNGQSNGSATASASGGVSPYSYSWSNGVQTQNIASLKAGTYTVTITDNNNCQATTTAIISQPVTLTSTATVKSNVSCDSGANGSIMANPSGGTSPYTYSWTNGNTTALATGLTAGSYSVNVTDNNGCTASASATITQPPAVIAGTIVDANVSCNGGANGKATAVGGGGVGSYKYLWNNGITTSIASALSAGTYTVTVSDKNGCPASATATVTQPAALTVTPTVVKNVSCNGGANGSIAASVSNGVSPYTYSWNNGETTSTAGALSAGTYTVTITDKNSCSQTASASVTQPAPINDGVNVTANITCNGGANGSASSNPSGGNTPYTYSWTNGAKTINATGLSAGTYTLTVTDNKGCQSAASVVITQPAPLVPTTSVISNVNCNGGTNGSAAVNPSGGVSPYTYSWSNSNTNATVNGLSSGTYTVTLTDNHGCTATNTVVITQPSVLTVSTTISVGCFEQSNGSAMANPAGGTSPYTYSWTNGKNTQSITGLSVGSYTITLTDKNGCTATALANITQPPALSVSASVNANVSCSSGANGSATATPSGGIPPYTYSWNNGVQTQNIASLSAGTYTVNVFDNNGCTTSASVIITQPTLLRDSIAAHTNVSCGSGSTGSATAGVKGGTSPYTYSWNPGGQTTPTASNLTAGTYTVTIKDKNGCTATASVLLTQPSTVVTTISHTNVSCSGISNGSATATTTGGASPYNYLWNPGGQTTDTASNLSAGTYTLFVTDSRSCSAVPVLVTITQPAKLRDSIVGAPSCSNHLSTATVGVKGGTTPYTYLWSPGGGTNATMSGLSNGTYSITVTDKNRCTAVAEMTADCSTAPGGRDGGNKSPNCCPVMDNTHLYPNPNTGQFSISGLEKGMIVEMYDYTGKLLSNSVADDNTMQFNLADQANGVYLVRIINSDGTLVSMKKVIKTN